MRVGPLITVTTGPASHEVGPQTTVLPGPPKPVTVSRHPNSGLPIGRDKLKHSGMGKIERDPYLNSIYAQVAGVILGILLIIPPLIRLSEGRWTGIDWVFVIGGGVIATMSLVFMVLGLQRRRRKRAELRRAQ